MSARNSVTSHKASIKPYFREGYHLFTEESWIRLLNEEKCRKLKELNKFEFQEEGKLIDGEIKFGNKVEEESLKPDPYMTDGCVVREEKTGTFPENLYGKPLEEIDENVFDKSFVVVNTKCKAKYIYRFTATKSLFLFSPWNGYRKMMLTMSTNQFFDYFIMVTILINCVFLAINGNYPISEYVFLAIYTLEMLIRISAKGFVINSYTYLRDPYNVLDISIVILSYVMLIVEKFLTSNNVNVSSLRTLRVLRALKAITILPGLKTIVSALIGSFQMILEVIILTSFCLIVFGLFGMQMFQGVLRNKCVMNANWTGIDNANYTTVDSYYYYWINNQENWLKNDRGYLTCGNVTGSGNCSNTVNSSTCLANLGPNPNFGYTNFDDFGWTLLAMIQMLTTDYFENQYYTVIRAAGSWNILYYIVTIFMGAFYLTNLMLAVVLLSYQQETVKRNREKEMELNRIKKLKSRSRKLELKAKKKLGLHKGSTIVDKDVDKKTDDNIVEKSSGEGGEDNSPNNSEDEGVDNDEKEEEETSKLSTAIDGTTDRNCLCCVTQREYYKKWLHFQNRLYAFVNDAFVDLFISLCILVNTVIMACEHYPSDDTWDMTLQYSNTIFMVVFVVEALLKILSMSKEYFLSGWNVFDLIVTVLSVVDVSVSQVKGLSVFRAFRLLRVFKLAQSWKTMKNLLTIIFGSVGEMANLSLVVILVIYMFAVIGMQSFSNTYYVTIFGDPIPRWNFNDFPHSMILVFRIICGEWIQTLWDCMRANGSVCMLVFIPTLVIGNFLVLNLFLALLLNTFDSDHIDSANADEESKFKIVGDRLKKLCNCRKGKSEDDDATQEVSLNTVATTKETDVDSGQGSEINTSTSTSVITTQTKMTDLKSIKNKQDSRKSLLSNSTDNSNNKKDSKTDDKENDEEKEKDPFALKDCCCEICYRCYQEGRPCFCCYCATCDVTTNRGLQWFKFRDRAVRITEHKAFEWIILSIILASSVSLCFEDIYLDDNVTTKTALSYLNYIYVTLFFIEMIMKIISLGFKVYFTSFWTILDFIVVLVSLTDIILNLAIPNSNQYAGIKAIRTLRALRPLRTISKIEGMKVVVNALTNSIPSIFNVLLVCLVMWLVFCICGVQFFKGKFFSCQDALGNDISANIVSNKSECMRQNQSWNNANINFDNVTNGLLALFQLATFQGWIEIMQHGVDITDIDQQPIKENSMGYFAFFVIFILIGSFFTLNLFIGVIIDNFNKLKNKYEGNYVDALLTPGQMNYYHTMKKFSNQRPKKMIKRPKNSIHGIFYDVAISSKFEVAIVTIIFLNVVAMMIDHYRQPRSYSQVLDIINVMFTAIYIFEAVFKIAGLSWHYFRYAWNLFDFIIVLLSIISIILTEIIQNSIITPSLLRVVRVFRIGRVLRLIKAAKGIRKLLFALVISLPAIVNIGALLLLIIFIYAIIGMVVFGNVQHNGVIDDLVNFETFERTMVLLFLLTTSAGWNDVLDALYLQPPNCNDSYTNRNGVLKKVSNGDCGIPWLAALYMTTYILITYLVIINMYVAIILENFNQAHTQEEIGVTEDDFDMFYEVWEKYDPYASQYIKYDNLSDFVANLSEPLGVPKPNIIALVSFDIPIVEEDKLHCLDVLIALVKKAIGGLSDTEEFKKITKEMNTKYEKIFPTRTVTKIIGSTLKRKKEDIAAKTLQRAWDRFKAQRAIKMFNKRSSISASSQRPPVPNTKEVNSTKNGKTDKFPTFLAVPGLTNVA